MNLKKTGNKRQTARMYGIDPKTDKGMDRK